MISGFRGAPKIKSNARNAQGRQNPCKYNSLVTDGRIGQFRCGERSKGAIGADYNQLPQNGHKFQ